MRRIRLPLVVVLICLPVAILATGIPLPYIDRPIRTLEPRPVPDGDQEIAFLYTATSAQTWERFVTGIAQASHTVDGMVVDDSAAFPSRTTAIPEVVIAKTGQAGNLRIRWYKLTNDTKAEQWVQALARRMPSPLAIIGGSSTDRAVDLALAIQQNESWQAAQPALLLTRATAESVQVGQQSRLLMELYPGRTFRFCFTNRQMAEAVLNFVESQPELRPKAPSPTLINVTWKDDPYSTDLAEQFETALTEQAERKPRVIVEHLPHSIGGLIQPNEHDRRAAASIVDRLRSLPDERLLLALPTVSRPGSRLLKRICAIEPTVCQRLVAVTGDGISVNDIYRDHSFAWPVEAMPVPLVLFTHNNPAGWDSSRPELCPPSSTEDLLFYAELVRVVVESAWPRDNGLSLVNDADIFVENLHQHKLFDAVGNRDESSGEHVIVLRPNRSAEAARLEVWRADKENGWRRIKVLAIPTK